MIVSAEKFGVGILEHTHLSTRPVISTYLETPTLTPAVISPVADQIFPKAIKLEIEPWNKDVPPTLYFLMSKDARKSFVSALKILEIELQNPGKFLRATIFEAVGLIQFTLGDALFLQPQGMDLTTFRAGV